MKPAQSIKYCILGIMLMFQHRYWFTGYLDRLSSITVPLSPHYWVSCFLG